MGEDKIFSFSYFRMFSSSLGCQTQYHLAKLGITNTVLLEKDQLTAGWNF